MRVISAWPYLTCLTKQPLSESVVSLELCELDPPLVKIPQRKLIRRRQNFIGRSANEPSQIAQEARREREMEGKREREREKREGGRGREMLMGMTRSDSPKTSTFCPRRRRTACTRRRSGQRRSSSLQGRRRRRRPRRRRSRWRGGSRVRCCSRAPPAS